MNENSYHVFFTNLANPLKIDIIMSLKEKKMCVGEICDKLDVEQSKISHALIPLKNCNIVNVKKEGKQRIYLLNKDTIVPIMKLIDKHSGKYCKGKCTSCNNQY